MLRFPAANRHFGIVIFLIMSLLVFMPNVAQAHRDGCHRWHSCPSDSGSYVCGDLGYTSECPNAVAPPPTPTPVPVEPPVVEPEITVQAEAAIQAETTVVTKESVAVIVIKDANLRAGPGITFDVVGSVSQGQIINLVDKNDDGTWYNLDNGQWIADFLVAPETTEPVATATEAPPETEQSTADQKTVTVLEDANLRAGPGTDFAIIGHATAGQVLEVIGQNEDGTWYQIVGESWIAAFLVS